MLIILQAAIGVGMIFYYVGIALLIAFTLGYSAMYVSIAKKKYLKPKIEKENVRITLIYIVSIMLGVLTTLLTFALFFFLLWLLYGDMTID